MKALKIPSGTRFGKLTVVKEVEKIGKNRRFLCKCDCGNETTVPLRDLRSGHTKTCGCRNLDLRRISIDDYIGKRYGMLVIIGEGKQELGKRYKVKCQCDCGSIKDYSLLNLLNPKMPTRSCGCARDIHEGIKARCKEKLYMTYSNMKQRCFNPNTPNYYNYGGRGITICDEWIDSYEAFRNWALNNGYDEGLTLDRENNDGNYEPSNCRWVNMKVQSNNKRDNTRITYLGETHSVSEWSDITGIRASRISARYKKGMPLERVFCREKLG